MWRSCCACTLAGAITCGVRVTAARHGRFWPEATQAGAALPGGRFGHSKIEWTHAGSPVDVRQGVRGNVGRIDAYKVAGRENAHPAPRLCSQKSAYGQGVPHLSVRGVALLEVACVIKDADVRPRREVRVLSAVRHAHEAVLPEAASIR